MSAMGGMSMQDGWTMSMTWMRMPGQTWPSAAATAWRHGLRLGLQCVSCCAGLTATLLVVGVMDLRAMAVVVAGMFLIVREL